MVFVCVFFVCKNRSFEAFVDAVAAINAGTAEPRHFDYSLASIATTYRTTAILEAGRLSLDHNSAVDILYANPHEHCQPTDLLVVCHQAQSPGRTVLNK